MRWIRTFLALAIVAWLPSSATAQGLTGRVTGIVTDRATSAPLPAVQVSVVGTTLGAQTDNTGRYSIGAVTAGAHQLRVMRIGYAPLTVNVQVTSGQAITADMQMSAAATTLSELVVIGYGAQKRSDLTGSVTSIKPNTSQLPILSLEQTLQGAAAGVTVTQASAAPGGGMSIRIRGGSSVTGNNEPLYVIDGFPIDNDPDGTSPTDGGRDASVQVPSNPLATLNPSDIESIEILKDASATSIYGARGANGVILITTKKGKGGTTHFTLDSYTGSQQIAHRYNLLNAQGFAEFANAWSAANGTAVVFADPASLGAGTDWQNAIFRKAQMGNVQLGITGGTTGKNSTLYALSGGVFNQDGIVLNSSFRRYSLRGSVDQTVGSRLRVTSSLSLSRVSSKSVPTDGSFNAGAGTVGAALQYYPTLSVRRADGTYTLLQADSKSPLAPAAVPNPLSMAADVKDDLTDLRVLASVSGEYKLFDGLKLRVTGGTDVANRARFTYYPRTTLLGSQTNGQALRGTTAVLSFVNENTLNYTKAIGDDHRFDLLAGYSRQSNETLRDAAKNTQFVSDIDGYESIGSGSQVGGPTISSGHTKYTLASYLARVNYAFKDRYLFTATTRRDGSSRFGADHQWGNFPSLAAAWRVSEEPFMQRFSNTVDQFKLRVSDGIVGNPSIRAYQSLARLNSQQYTFGGGTVNGYFPASVPNPNLTWESTRQRNYGVDLGLWDSRLSITADMYRKKTNSLLLAVNLPMESGFATALQNVGSVSNNGFEAAITIDLLRASGGDRGFSWQTTFTYSKNKNEVNDLGGVTQIFATSVNSDLKLLGSLIRVGQPLGVFYGYKVDGVIRDSATAAAYTTAVKPLTGTAWKAGDSRLVDVNGDGAITVDDRTIIGDPNAKYTGGWQNTFGYKGVRLSTSLDFTQGNQILNLNLARLEGGSPMTNVIADRWYDSWTPTNLDAKYPRVNFTPGSIGSDMTSDLLEDGSFVRLRAVTVDYLLPTSWLSRAGVSTARVYVSGSNLITWTKYSGFNPDVSSLGLGNVNRGVDVGAYPLAKSFTFGVNLTY